MKYSDYPESCPPNDAIQVEGVYYRLCKSEKFLKEDFLTHIDADLPFPDDKLCAAMALSFYDSIEHANMLKKKFKKKFGSHTVKPVKILKSYGIGTLEEVTGHLNLWEYRDVDIFGDITKVEEDNHE